MKILHTQLSELCMEDKSHLAVKKVNTVVIAPASSEFSED